MDIYFYCAYIVTAIIACCVSLLLYYVLCIYYNSRTYAHIPSPPCASFLLGHVKDIRLWRKNGGTYMTYILKTSSDYGPIFVLRFLHQPTVFLGDPSCLKKVLIENHSFALKNTYSYQKLGYVFGSRLIGEGLVTNTDDHSWRKRRSLMNPAFHRKCLKDFMGDFNEVCDEFMVRLMQVAEKKQVASMAQEFGNVTVDVISQVSFNIKIGAVMNPDNTPFTEAIATSLRGVHGNLTIPLSATMLSLFKYWPLLNDSRKRQIEAVEFLRQFARDCVVKRKVDIAAGVETPNDLLAILLSDDSLSMEDIIDEFLTIFIAGQETTANSLAFTLLEISRNPDIEAKVLNEINSVLESNRDTVQFEHLAQLKYLGQVMQESLRMYPVAGGTGRILGKDMVLSGYKLPKGTWIRVPKMSYNYNPEYWPNPTQFDPDRFADPEKIPNFSTIYFPFNIGPRNCIGQVFSKFESKVILARILRKFKFELLPGQTAALEERMTNAPRDGVMCNVTLRT